MEPFKQRVAAFGKRHGGGSFKHGLSWGGAKHGQTPLLPVEPAKSGGLFQKWNWISSWVWTTPENRPQRRTQAATPMRLTKTWRNAREIPPPGAADQENGAPAG
jgi:hypothetical protein